MPNCDPSTLANQARCFNCVIPVGDQLAVQSYVLAKLVGYATDSDGANQLANDARCFSCTIPPGDLLQVQTYLISLISETTIAAEDLPNAARCFMSCVPLGEQNALKSYLLDQVASLGGIAISTDPAVLVNDARCISCVVPIGDQTAVQTWLLALLANVDTTDPSGIANAARCYASCIPIGDQIPVQNYLLCQTQAIVTPPCVTPGSPFQVGVGTRGTTDTSTQLGVRWLQQNNTGSLITSYTVKWGTTAGGPYTFNSGPVPINPKFYLATGLTAGTTYYFIVVANSFSGCSSANSAEANGTTTGGAAAPCATGTTFANAWSARVVANGGAAPSAATLTAIANFQCGLITDGLDTQMVQWNAIVPDNLLAAFTPQLLGPGIRDPWVNGGGFVAGDLTINGLAGAAAGNKYSATGLFANTAYSSDNDCGISIYLVTNPNSNSCDIGVTQGANLSSIQPFGGTTFFDSYAIAGRISAANAGFIGFISGNRVAGPTTSIYEASSTVPFNTLVTANVASGGNRPNLEYYAWAMNNNAVQASLSDHRMSFIAFHHGLTSAQSQLLFNRVQTLRTALGGGFV